MKKIKVISSENVERCYVKNFMRNKANREKEEMGWKEFGPITAVYNEETDETLFIQVLVMEEK